MNAQAQNTQAQNTQAQAENTQAQNTALTLKASGTPLANISAIVKSFKVENLVSVNLSLDEKKAIIELSGGDSVNEKVITSAIKSARSAMNKVDKATTETFLYAYIGSKAMDVKNVKNYLQKFFPVLDYSSTMKYFKALDSYCINPEMTALVLKFGYTKLARLFDSDESVRLQIMLSIQNGDIAPSDSVSVIMGKVKALKPVIDVKPTGKPAIDEKPTGKPAIDVKPTGKPAIDEKPTGKPAIDEKPTDNTGYTSYDEMNLAIDNLMERVATTDFRKTTPEMMQILIDKLDKISTELSLISGKY